jgi:hypothetical protein
MGDDDRSRHLPQRVRGAARDGSASSGPPVLSEEMRQRIQAAVRAERAAATGQDQAATGQHQEHPAEPPRRGAASEPAGGARSPVGVKINGEQKGPDWSEPAVKDEHVVEPERRVKGGHAVKRERILNASSAVKPGHAITREPAQRSRSEGKGPESQRDRKVPAEQKSALSVEVRTTPPDSRPQGEAGPRRFGKVRMAAFAVVLVAAGSLITAVSLHIATSSGGSGAVSTAALQSQEAATRLQAAKWVARQVDLADVVSCDHVMCAALRTAGFPAGKLLALEPTSSPPVTSAVVVVTAAVRSMFGSSIDAAWAPDVLASFGSGAAAITIRVIAPHGALAYHSALSAGMESRINQGTGLLGNALIQLSPAAKKQLGAGQVDSRLDLALADMASDHPIYVIRFENIGPGVSTDLPLRFADLTVNGNPAHMSDSSYVSAMRASLSSPNSPLGPVSGQTALSGGQDIFQVEFPAPSPLG